MKDIVGCGAFLPTPLLHSAIIPTIIFHATVLICSLRDMMPQRKQGLIMGEIKPIQKKRLSNIVNDYSGKHFGRLKIMWVVGSKNKRAVVRCLCDCGNVKDIYLYNILRKSTKSCGCLLKSRKAQAHASFKHGGSNTVEYKAWNSMKTVVISKSEKVRRKYHKISARGITICDRWLDDKMGFINFFEDMGRKPSPKHKLTRLDKTKSFNGENCKWIMKEKVKL